MSGKFGEIIDKAKQTKKPDNQTSGFPESQIANNPETQKNEVISESEKMVNLCVKIPQSLRQHWAAEAKRQGITMTAVITEALMQKFGEPENQIEQE